jgi:autotransporter-associated beta strand protein
MRFPRLVCSGFLSLLTALFSAGTAKALDLPLGGIGGVCDLVPGTGLISVTSVTPGGPGANAGLMRGDLIQGADGVLFSSTSTDDGMGFIGALQDLAMAVDRAEGNGGALTLRVIRSGVGAVNLNLTLNAAGTLGPAWPANTGKTAAMFEWSCDQIHSKVQASSTADFGYNSGWFGIILLSHPDWNQTTGSNPFRNSINKLRTRCENYINGRVLQPVEAFYWNGSDVIANPAYVSPGLENWDVCTSAMFLALYRSKTSDATTNTVVQRAAEAIAHRIQHWTQYDDPGIPHVIGGGVGRMGHGGVHGDYSHYNGTGALNIINAHALPALALLKNAGANMSTNLGLSVNAFTYNPGLVQPTIEQKFRICWDYVKAATTTSGGGDDGNVGYVGTQSGWDSAGRTPGCFAGWNLYGMAANADDITRAAKQADYFTRRWYRQQHAHAYTLGGVVLSQLAMPFLDYRRERFFQENTRLYPALARKPDGSIAYFPGRQNNGGDSYLDNANVALINSAMPVAIRTGNLPGFPAPDPTRIHAWMRSPINSWPAIEARRVVLTGGLSHSLDLDITDVNGAVLAPANYSANWTHVSGPSVVSFGSPASADTSVTLSQAGTYRVNLQVTRGAYVLNEPYDLVVSTTTPPADVAPYLVAQPENQTADQGSSVTFTLNAQGTAPLIYQWRRNGVTLGLPSTTPSLTLDSVAAGSAGTYDCVISNAAGTTTSASATLVVNGVGAYRWGGLWRDVFTGISGSTVANLTSSASYPSFPNVSGKITNGEAPSSYADNYGQRLSGWITPPQTGNYRFYIACDDAAELWVSTTNRRANRVLVARESTFRTSRNWPTSTSDESVSPQLSLIGGQRYYIELLHKEGGGGDNAAITWNWQSTGVWATPASGSTPLPGAILEYQEGGTSDDQAHPPANYAPNADSKSLVVFGGAFTDVLLTAADFENSALTYSILTNPTKGTLSGTAPNLVYTPFPGSSGVDSFTFSVSDGSLSSDPATITLSVVPESGSDLKVWNGSTDTLWTTAANWSGAVAPDSNDAILFNGDSLSNLATSLNGNRTASRIVVQNPAGAVSIANNILTLSGGIEMLPATANLTISSGVTLSAAQEWSVGSGRTLLVSGALAGTSALTKTGSGTLEISAVGSTTAGIIVNGGTLRLSGGGWFAGNVGGTGMLTVNAGASAINVNAHSFGSGNNPERDITLNGGSFLLNAETYVDDVTSTAGTIANTVGGGGDLRSRIGNNSVFTVNASDFPTNVDASFNAVGSWSISVANGSATHDLVMSGAITNTGAITKSGLGRMLVSSVCTHTGAFTLSAGELAVTGSLSPTSALTVQTNGTLSGTGTIQGTVTQNGILSPGVDGIAVLNLGALTQAAGSTTRITLNGTTAGSGHDQVAVAGAATLGGTLQVSLSPGFVPEVGNVFDVVTCATRSGTYGTLSLPALPSDRTWTTTYNGGPTAGLRLSVAAVAPPSYTLTYTAGANGSLTGTTPQSIVQGANGSSVTAVPNPGYNFVSWSDGVLSASRTDTNIQANKSVTATFAIKQYSVSYSAGANGSISGNTSQTVNHGASATTATAVPNTGYNFVSWSDGVLTAARTDTNNQANLSVSATFVIKQYSVSYSAGANGSISGNTSQTVSHGSNATTVTAVPNVGYSFVAWSDGVLTAARTDTNLQANKSVTATFAINQYTVTYTAGANGSITGSSPQTINHGSDATTVTAVPNSGYSLVAWSDGVLTAARTDTGLQANKSVTATFAINQYTATYSAGANGSITGSSPQTINHGSNATTVTAVPNTGYSFVSWSDGVLTAARTDTNLQANLSVTATFAINQYAVTYTAGANGSISGTTNQTVNHGSDATTVTAVPNTGYSFVSWSDGILTAARTDTNLQANLSVTATFAINQYAVSYTAGANGSITGSATQTVNHGSDATTVTAVPNTGYSFVSWSDGVLTAARTDTNLQANLNVTATFAINQYAVTYAAGANGSITGATNQTVNHGSDATTATAVPNTGYSFVSWSDGLLTAARTDTNLQANLSVTATFATNQYTVTYTAGANGSITGTATQTVNHGSNATTVTAVPGSGYSFVSWSDGVLTAARTDTNLQADKSVTATFAMAPYDSWVTNFPDITNPTDREPAADPDKDGLANSIEFVTGSDPSKPSSGSPLTTNVGTTHVVFQFVRVKAAGEAGFVSRIELSDQLGTASWNPADPGAVAIIDNGTTETVSVTLPLVGAGKRFARIKVIAP